MDDYRDAAPFSKVKTPCLCVVYSGYRSYTEYWYVHTMGFPPLYHWGRGYRFFGFLRMNGSAGAFFLRALGCCVWVRLRLAIGQTSSEGGFVWIHLGCIRRGA